MSEIKGKHLIGLIKFLASRGPSVSLARVLEACPNVKPIYDKRISPLLWYPFAAMVEPMEKYVEIYEQGREQAFFDMGAAGGQRDVENTYKVVFQGDPNAHPLDFIKMGDFFWKDSFKNAGSLSVLDVDGNGCVMEIRDFPELRHPYCRNLEGWLDFTANASSRRFTTQVRLEGCIHKDRPTNRYKVAWTPNS